MPRALNATGKNPHQHECAAHNTTLYSISTNSLNHPNLLIPDPKQPVIQSKPLPSARHHDI